jgi:hypothetical protein
MGAHSLVCETSTRKRSAPLWVIGISPYVPSIAGADCPQPHFGNLPRTRFAKPILKHGTLANEWLFKSGHARENIFGRSTRKRRVRSRHPSSRGSVYRAGGQRMNASSSRLGVCGSCCRSERRPRWSKAPDMNPAASGELVAEGSGARSVSLDREPDMLRQSRPQAIDRHVSSLMTIGKGPK